MLLETSKIRVARFFSVQIPKREKTEKLPDNTYIPKGHTIFLMAVK
jgi:hypothetical protein